MKKALYFECAAGISGDMTVAALLDLGADEEMLRRVLSSVPVGGFQIEISHVKKAGVLCKDFHVILDEEHENHDHDMNYLHGNLSEEHHHDHHHEHHYHEHHHHHDHHHADEVFTSWGLENVAAMKREDLDRILVTVCQFVQNPV